MLSEDITNEEYKDNIADFLSSIGTKTDDEIFYNLKKTYSDVIYEIYSNKPKYNSLYSNSRFLSVLYQVLYTIHPDKILVTYCDSILYYTITSLSLSSYIKGLLFMIGELVNKNDIEQLKKITTIDYELLVFLAITNHSISDDMERISRVNFSLCTSANKVLSISEIKSIYSVFYHKEFSSLLLGSIFDTTIDRGIEHEDSWVTDLVKANSAQLKNALLMILDNLEQVVIEYYLKMIAESFAKRGYNEYTISIRFKNILPNTFGNIYNCVKRLEMENIYIP